MNFPSSALLPGCTSASRAVKRSRTAGVASTFSNVASSCAMMSFGVAAGASTLVTSNLTPQHHGRVFNRALDYITAGDCSQVNLAQRFSAQVSGDPWLAYQWRRLPLHPAVSHLPVTIRS